VTAFEIVLAATIDTASIHMLKFQWRRNTATHRGTPLHRESPVEAHEVLCQ
jgi:hypothetical protein